MLVLRVLVQFVKESDHAVSKIPQALDLVGGLVAVLLVTAIVCSTDTGTRMAQPCK